MLQKALLKLSKKLEAKATHSSRLFLDIASRLQNYRYSQESSLIFLREYC